MSVLISAYAPTRRALFALSTLSTTPLSSAIRPSNSSSSSPSSLVQHRCASHASQGRANRAKRGPGKRLGLKKGASEPVVPNNIIFRQRGTGWFAGENCVMGRDHTINALQPGFVRYYRDPARHPTRKYIGVVLQQHETLPRPVGAARRRRLGMVARPIREANTTENVKMSSSAVDGEVNGEVDGEVEVEIRTDAPRNNNDDDDADANKKSSDTAGLQKATGIIPLPRSFIAAGRTMTNAQIGQLGDRVTAKLKREDRARTKLRILRDKLNIRKRRMRRRAAGKGTKQAALFDKRERKLRRAKGRYRGKR